MKTLNVSQAKKPYIQVVLVLITALIGLSFLIIPTYDYRSLRVFSIFTRVFEIGGDGIIVIVLILVIYFAYIKLYKTNTNTNTESNKPNGEISR